MSWHGALRWEAEMKWGISQLVLLQISLFLAVFILEFIAFRFGKIPGDYMALAGIPIAVVVSAHLELIRLRFGWMAELLLYFAGGALYVGFVLLQIRALRWMVVNHYEYVEPRLFAQYGSLYGQIAITVGGGAFLALGLFLVVVRFTMSLR